jgi:hypothetical protein
MATKGAALTEQQFLAMKQGLADLWALAFKHRTTLERVLGFNREINAYLTLKRWDDWIDFQGLILKLTPCLEQANLFLQQLDATAEQNDIHQAELIAYGKQLVLEMKSGTVKPLYSKFQQFAETIQDDVDEAQSSIILAKIKAEDEVHHRDHVTKAGYMENADGTVTDVKTHLMWMQCAQGQVGPLCEGVVLQYTWDLAMNIPVTLNQRGGFAGYTDWRLPTVQELQSLVKTDSHPTICLDAFPNAPESLFWTSTQLHEGTNEGKKDENALVWNVYFGTGSLGANAQYNSYAVRLVRSYA